MVVCWPLLEISSHLHALAALLLDVMAERNI